MEKQAICGARLRRNRSLRSTQTAFPNPERLSALGGMIAFVCHDLRLPLTAILANAELLSRLDTSELEKREFFEEIRCSVESMNELVSSLLERFRDCDTFRPGVGNIVDTVERAIDLLSVRQEFRRITIEHHHRGATVGWFDSNHLERAVANLVLNACEAVSPDSGLIVVSTIGNQNHLQISVGTTARESTRRSGLPFSSCLRATARLTATASVSR